MPDVGTVAVYARLDLVEVPAEVVVPGSAGSQRLDGDALR
jgi:hypothetical protein